MDIWTFLNQTVLQSDCILICNLKKDCIGRMVTNPFLGLQPYQPYLQMVNNPRSKKFRSSLHGFPLDDSTVLAKEKISGLISARFRLVGFTHNTIQTCTQIDTHIVYMYTYIHIYMYHTYHTCMYTYIYSITYASIRNVYIYIYTYYLNVYRYLYIHVIPTVLGSPIPWHHGFHSRRIC